MELEVEVQKQEPLKAEKACNKARALSWIQRKAALGKKFSGSQASPRKLNDILLVVDAAERNRDSVAALETGTASSQLETETDTAANRVDDIAAKLEELFGQQKELRLALEHMDPNKDQELISTQNELEALLAADTGNELEYVFKREEGASRKPKEDSRGRGERRICLADGGTRIEVEGKTESLEARLPI